MRLSPLSRSGAALAAVLALAACGEATAPPEPLASRYVLTRVNGAAEPFVIADYTYPSGTRQVWLMTYDTLAIRSDTDGRRSFLMTMFTASFDGATVPPLLTRFKRDAQVSRTGDRVVFDYYEQSGSPFKPDTLYLRDGKLVKQGPYGVSCADCPPPAQVEYIYEPR